MAGIHDKLVKKSPFYAPWKFVTTSQEPNTWLYPEPVEPNLHTLTQQRFSLILYFNLHMDHLVW
jgi:hypothetical protein